MKERLYVSVSVAGDPVDLILGAPARDANLMACLLYLLAWGLKPSRTKSKPLWIKDLAAAYSVSTFAVVRWLRGLVHMGLISLQDGGQGAWLVGIDAGIFAAASPVLAQPARPEGVVKATEETTGLEVKGDRQSKNAPSQSKNASSPPPSHTLPPPANNNNKAKARDKSKARAQEPIVLSQEQELRLTKALESFGSWPIISARAGLEELRLCLAAVVANQLFDRLVLAWEIQSADAWLAQSRVNYTDMKRFLINWLRRSAASANRYVAKRTNNNPPPTPSKYAGLHEVQEK